MSWPAGGNPCLHHAPSFLAEQAHAASAESQSRVQNRASTLFEDNQLRADMGRMEMADNLENPPFVCLEFDDFRFPHSDQGLNAIGLNG